MAGGQVVVDGLGSPVHPQIGQALSQQHDLLGPGIADASRAAMRSLGAGLQAGRALPAVAGQQLVQPAAVDPVGLGQLPDRFASPQCVSIRNRALSTETSALGCLLCLDTPLTGVVADVLKSDTVRTAVG